MLRTPDRERLALFLDIDGTLVDIAARPTEVFVPPGLVDVLRAVNECLSGAVALVSGRAIEDLDRLFRPLRLRAAGVHGAERRVVPNGTIEEGVTDPLSPALLSELKTMLRDFPGVTVEDKRHAFAVHYRAVPHFGGELGIAVRRFVDARQELVAMPGHCIFELKRPGHSKGTAVADFMRLAPFAGRVPVFIGDDVTDMAGFEAVHKLGGTCYSVGREMRGVDDWFETPDDVRGWLERIVGMTPAEP